MVGSVNLLHSTRRHYKRMEMDSFKISISHANCCISMKEFLILQPVAPQEGSSYTSHAHNVTYEHLR